MNDITYYWQSTPQLWMAVFDNYDGAIDSKHPQGFGRTKEEAAADLLEQEAERGYRDAITGADPKATEKLIRGLKASQ